VITLKLKTYQSIRFLTTKTHRSQTFRMLLSEWPFHWPSHHCSKWVRGDRAQKSSWKAFWKCNLLFSMWVLAHIFRNSRSYSLATRNVNLFSTRQASHPKWEFRMRIAGLQQLGCQWHHHLARAKAFLVSELLGLPLTKKKKQNWEASDFDKRFSFLFVLLRRIRQQQI